MEICTMNFSLHTDHLVLREVSADDAYMLAKWKSTPLLREMSTGLDTEINELNQRGDIKSSILFGNIYLIIELKSENNLPIGYIRINWDGKSHKNAWLCYGMISHYREGYCYEALRELLASMYEHDLLYNLTAEVYEFNKASRGLLRKLHFVENRRMIKNYYYKGRSWDTIEYVITQDMAEHLKREDRKEQAQDSYHHHHLTE